MNTHSLIHAAVVIAVFGVIFWLVDTYIPIAEPFKTIARVIIVVVLVLVLLNLVGILA